MIKPFLPNYSSIAKGGRPRISRIRIAKAIFLILKTGGQWKLLPRSLCSGSTAHAYFQQWCQLGIFEKLWRETLWQYDAVHGLKTEYQCVDVSMTKSPLGQEMTGPNPTYRGKKGVKRSLLKSANSIPIGLAIAGANVHDSQLLQLTIHDAMATLCWTGRPQGDYLCLDKAYGSSAIQE